VPKKHTRTKSSSFGSGGRSGHDASQFYKSRLYTELEAANGKAIIAVSDHMEIALAPDQLNRIYCASAQKMSELPDGCIHLMVTSPPYNAGKDYDEDLSLDEYLSFLRSIWAETLRVLVPGGRACINVANLGRKPYLPLNKYITTDMLGLGFSMRGEVIWDKGASAAASTAWGSWKSASNPTLRDVHEYILVFSKGDFKRKPLADRQSTISRDEFLEYTKSVWSFPAESARKVGHPAPFPVELPYRLIQLYTFSDEVVLDPFMGSGQTAIAALKVGRKYVGYELNPDYIKLAESRISNCINH